MSGLLAELHLSLDFPSFKDTYRASQRRRLPIPSSSLDTTFVLLTHSQSNPRASLKLKSRCRCLRSEDGGETEEDNKRKGALYSLKSLLLGGSQPRSHEYQSAIAKAEHTFFSCATQVGRYLVTMMSTGVILATGFQLSGGDSQLNTLIWYSWLGGIIIGTMIGANQVMEHHCRAGPRNIVITGSTRGLGKALAREFLLSGDRVVVASRSPESVQATVGELQENLKEGMVTASPTSGANMTNAKVVGIACDVCKPEDVEKLANFAIGELGSIDLWINNAGMNKGFRPLLEFADEDIKQIVSTNLVGSLLCTREAMRVMRSQGKGGHIFNMDGAGSGGSSTPLTAVYGSTKCGLRQLQASLLKECKRSKVGVHTASPGMVLTDLLLSGSSLQNKQMFNIICELPETVARTLVPRMRIVKGSGNKTLSAMEEFAIDDPTQLLAAASDFAHYPGVQNDDAVRNFLERFPLPAIIGALQCKADVPGLETTLVACLERVFNTKYGTSLIPHYMPFIQVGLQAQSHLVRCLACKTVSRLLDNVNDELISAALVIDHGIYTLLLDCLVNGDEQLAKASTDAIKSFAKYPIGLEVIFPANGNKDTSLSSLAPRCSSVGRIRVLSLIVKLFSVSSSAVSKIYNSNLLGLFEAEIQDANDMLATLSVLELLYELSEAPNGTDFLSRGTFLQLLTSTIRNPSMESILRSRAIIIIGRLFSSESNFAAVGESCVKTAVSVIGERLEALKDDDTDEFETAVEALGQIGSSIQGAVLLFLTSSARHLFEAAFARQGRVKHLAALHALANIVGESRPDDRKMLNDNAEESLRSLMYEIAARSSKLTPSGLLLSILQQEPETRLAAYRLITGLVARPWCLIEVCSKQDIISIVTDPHNESTKNGMEARYNCCLAIHKALSSSSKLVGDPSLAEIAEKLHEAVKRGPYLTRERIEAQPLVVTAER